MQESLFEIYLLSNGQLFVREEEPYEGGYKDPDSPLDKVLLDKCIGKDSRDQALAYWQKIKQQASVTHYNSFYLLTRLSQLEDKLTQLTKHLSRIL